MEAALQLTDVDFSTLESVKYRSGRILQYLQSGEPVPRLIYRDSRYFYKIWNKSYSDHLSVVHDGKLVRVDNRSETRREMLLGFKLGLYDETVCPGFAGYIYDGDRLAGYRTLAGELPDKSYGEDSLFRAYLACFIDRSIQSGFVHLDFKRRNMVRLPDGRFSLIDLEHPIATINKLCLIGETEHLSVRRAVDPQYFEFLYACGTGNKDHLEARIALARWSTAPPAFEVATDGFEQPKRTAPLNTPPTYIPGIKLPSGEITPGRRAKPTMRLRNATVASSFDLKGKRVLDVGCSHGLYSLYMAGAAKEVIGIDHRMSQIKMARDTAAALGIENVTFDCVDVRDPGLFAKYKKFDLVVAWGFVHRVSDLFSLLYNLEPLSDVLSLEWRTPVLPLMSSLPIAYHPPKGRKLDPMNVKAAADKSVVKDEEKIEGSTAFWQPTPGAVKVILERLGYKYNKILGFDEEMHTEEQTLLRYWLPYLDQVNERKARLDRYPVARVHALFMKQEDAISMTPFGEATRKIPEWDEALRARFKLA